METGDDTTEECIEDASFLDRIRSKGNTEQQKNVRLFDNDQIQEKSMKIKQKELLLNNVLLVLTQVLEHLLMLLLEQAI